jgi:hypothetical protein
MQSFWVRLLEGADNQTLTFDDARRSHADHLSNVLKVAGDAEPDVRPLVRLSVSNGKNTDETVIYAHEAAATGFDDYDSDKWFNANGVEIFTRPLASDTELAINGLPEIVSGLEIPLGFQAEEGGNFSFRAKEVQLSDTLNLILRDKLRNIEFDLRNDGDYNFASGSAPNTERFSILFRSVAGNDDLLDNDSEDNLLVYANRIGQIIVELNIGALQGSLVDVSVYDVVGRKLAEQPVVVGDRTVLDGTFPEGVYVLRTEKWAVRVVVRR